MRRWTRRDFGRVAGLAGLSGLRPRRALAQAKARVLVIGGGAGGATVAKYVALSTATLDVTLLEPNPRYTTCFFSNLYLAGLRSLESLTHGYEALATKYGIRIVRDLAAAIDPGEKVVQLKGGGRLSYDRLVVAPGVAFKYGAIEGYDEAATQMMPHAWIGGAQTRLLREQLESMADGGVFLLVAPPNPFRCPPGPYERASLIAAYFKRYKPRAKILILDAKDSFPKQELFLDAWSRYYPGMIEWLPAQFTGGVKAVDVKSRSVATASETFKAAVVNVIPPQIAGDIARKGGLTDDSGWCPVNPETLESKLQASIHVVGDAIIAGEMPKSAFAANSQAKVCAFAIAAALTGAARFPPHFLNACWSFVAADDAVRIGASYKAENGQIKATESFASKLEESRDVRAAAAREAQGWYAAFTADIFG